MSTEDSPSEKIPQMRGIPVSPQSWTEEQDIATLDLLLSGEMLWYPRSMQVTQFLHVRREIPDAAIQTRSPVPVLCTFNQKSGMA